jgi:hypothetical protein
MRCSFRGTCACSFDMNAVHNNPKMLPMLLAYFLPTARMHLVKQRVPGLPYNT